MSYALCVCLVHLVNGLIMVQQTRLEMRSGMTELHILYSQGVNLTGFAVSKNLQPAPQCQNQL